MSMISLLLSRQASITRPRDALALTPSDSSAVADAVDQQVLNLQMDLH